MASQKCAGCLNSINTNKCMNCSFCHEWYDLDCANLTLKQYRLITDKKISWKCAGCRNNEPKDKVITSPSPPRQVHEYTTEGDEEDIPLTGRALKAIINQEITCKLSNIISEQKNLTDLVDSFQRTISFLSDRYDDLKMELDVKTEKIAILEKSTITLQETVQNLTKRLNNTEQHARANNIEIQCVPEKKSENVIDTLLGISKVIKSKVKDADISHCTRIAKKDSESTRPRSILVKFNTPRLRDEFLAAAIQFNRNHPQDRLNTSHLGAAADKAQPIYVVEHLSAENKSLHAAARVLGKELGYRFVWVRNGRIFMKKSEDSDRIVIDSAEKLKTLY